MEQRGGAARIKGATHHRGDSCFSRGGFPCSGGGGHWGRRQPKALGLDVLVGEPVAADEEAGHAGSGDGLMGSELFQFSILIVHQKAP